MSLKSIAPLIASVFIATAGYAQTAATVQSIARPFGLPIAGNVMVGGSDAASATFQSTELPALTQYLSNVLGEGQDINDHDYLLDPSKLVLKTDANVRAYFIGEGAGYQNTLGYNTGGGGVTSGDPTIIFPNASTSGSTRSSSAPLQAGDFVDLGTISGGQKLDFFLIANGATPTPGATFSTDQSVNPDGINHVVSFAAIHGSYLVIGFEDLLGGGDEDFNDVLFAIDIGSINIAALTGTPEPATYMTMGLFLTGGLWVMRRRKAAKA